MQVRIGLKRITRQFRHLVRIVNRDDQHLGPVDPRRHQQVGPRRVAVIDPCAELAQRVNLVGIIVDNRRFVSRRQKHPVDDRADPGLWSLLERAEAQGLPALINTSFNRHGEPIVETVPDALELLAAGVVSAVQC
ncbi:MAG: hypothetical protein EX258_10225, partial [Sphingomonadaceae bacterium]